MNGIRRGRGRNKRGEKHGNKGKAGGTEGEERE